MREITIHPLSILSGALIGLRQLLVPMVFAVFGFRSDNDGLSFGAVGIGLGIGFGLSAMFQLVRVLTTKVRVDSKSIELKAGIIWTVHQVVPLDRIQEIHLKASLPQRLLGLQEVLIETAGGNDKLNINALSVQDATLLRDSLIGRKSVAFDAGIEGVAPQEPPLVTLPLGDLIFAGALENRAFYLMIAVFGFAAESSAGRRLVTNELEGATGTVDPLRVLVFFVLFFMIGWLVSIAITVNKYYGFRIERTARGLKVSHGLTTATESSMRVDRVQLVTMRQPLLFRLGGLYRLEAKCASQMNTTSENKEFAAGVTLTPASKTAVVWRILEIVLPQYDPRHFAWKKVPLKGYWLAVPGILILSAILVGVWWPLKNFSVAALPLGFIPIVAYSTFLGIRNSRYGCSQGLFASRRGGWWRIWQLSPVSKVQGLTITESPLGRKMGLVQVNVAFPEHAIPASGIELGEAKVLVDQLLEERHRHPGRGV